MCNKGILKITINNFRNTDTTLCSTKTSSSSQGKLLIRNLKLVFLWYGHTKRRLVACHEIHKLIDLISISNQSGDKAI